MQLMLMLERQQFVNCKIPLTNVVGVFVVVVGAVKG
jgi:hypothetical protein